MSADPGQIRPTREGTRAEDRLLRLGVERLGDFSQALRPLRDALRNIEQLGDEETARRAIRLRRQLDSIEPSVTMIGQVKSGKTSLVNAMIGRPGLLPADVNPWTSVVTSLHLSPTPLTPETSARFRFFDQSEWDRLVTAGGRVGELANRAGAEAELETIREQIALMREKSMARLGRKFEMLLGQEHNYGHFDQELIERYVCLGDEFNEDEPVAASQGRFADITKSADLFLQRAAIPVRLCLRDTPGVNDTFMMREQITIQAIRDSRLCVVVLSAHQALSSSDLAMIRIISNIKSREVIIFVNRIDELSDPRTQVAEIRASILDTLRLHKGPTHAEIVFGSALWANFALSGSLSKLPRASAQALYNWAEAGELSFAPGRDPLEILWELSGVPGLYRAIAERIVEGVAREATDRIATSAVNLLTGIAATEQVGTGATRPLPPADPDQVGAAFDAIQSRSLAALDREFDTIMAAFSDRVDRAMNTFLDRATASLVSHLEQYGEHSVWQYDPAGLRVLLSSSYVTLGTASQKAFRTLADTAASEMTALCQRVLGLEPDQFRIKAPPAPRIAPPVMLGRTIALDLKGSWWKSWWFRRRGYRAYAANFHDMIKAEIEAFVADLKAEHANAVRTDALRVLTAFHSEQRAILIGAVQTGNGQTDRIDELLGLGRQRARAAVIAKTETLLKDYAP